MDFSRLDPSLALAFYLKTRADYEALTAALAALSSGSSANGSSGCSGSGSAMQVPFVVEAAPPSYECEAGMSSMLASCDTDDDRAGGGSGDEEEDSYVFI
jgi:hypothetical protein